MSTQPTPAPNGATQDHRPTHWDPITRAIVAEADLPRDSQPLPILATQNFHIEARS